MSDDNVVADYRNALRATVEELNRYRSTVAACIRALDTHEAREPYQTLQLIDQLLRPLAAQPEVEDASPDSATRNR